MARLASHTIVLRMKRITRLQDDNTTVETVDHIAVTTRRRVLMKSTVIRHDSQGTSRHYGKWIHKERIRPRVPISAYQYRHTLEGWTTVSSTPEQEDT